MKNVGPCRACGCEMWIPDALYETAQHDSKIWFHCAYGHNQHYPKTPTERREDALRRERDRLAQRIAQRDDQIGALQNRQAQIERRLSATKGVVTRTRNRVGRGVCPCCDKTFENLTIHMKNKHADFADSPVTEAEI